MDRPLLPSTFFDLTIGTRQFASVEIPGRVINVGNALEALNGEAAVSRALSSVTSDDNCDTAASVSSLQLRLRPDDPFSRPIDGTVTDSTTLLMEVRRRRDGAITPRIIGRVGKTGRFQSLSDFQVVHKTPFQKEMQLLPPVAMSNIATPREYRFRDHATGETRRKRLESRISDHHNRFSRFALISFDAKTVPMGPEAGSFAASDAAMNHPVTQLLIEEFKKRPLISKRLLLHTMRLANQDRRSVIRYIYCVAYRFSVRLVTNTGSERILTLFRAVHGEVFGIGLDYAWR
jgi:hypothetical protein